MPRPKKKQPRHDILGDADGATDPSDGLRINERYAEQYEVRKRREELSKARKLLEQQDEEDDTSEEEDEDAELLTDKLEGKIFDTLERIKRKDPAIYDAKHTFFSEEDFQQDEQDASAAADKKAKPLTYKDLVRKTLEEGGAEAFTHEEEQIDSRHTEAATNERSYVEEQHELKKAFLDAATKQQDDNDDASGSEEGDLFELKEKSAADKAEEERDYERFLSRESRKGPKDEMQSLSHYWAPDEELDSNEVFLRDYILNRGWLEGNRMPQAKDGDDEDAEEEHLEDVDDFERKYNFRYEEEGGGQIESHPRFPEASVRRRDDKRKQQRAQKKQRKQEEKVRRDEELKRLKNLKKQEIQERLRQITQITGNKDADVSGIDLESDWDEAQHEATMKALFGDDYDDRQEEVPDKQLLQPPSGFDDLLGNSDATKGRKRKRDPHDNTADAADGHEDEAQEWEGEGEGEGEDQGEAPIGDGDAEEQQGEEEVGEWWMCDQCGKGIPAGQKRFDCLTCDNFTLCKVCFRNVRHPHQLVRRKVPQKCHPPADMKGVERVPAAVKGAMDDVMDEYFQLDYEDIIGGDLPTRFKYEKVHPESHGLTVRDILYKDDKELNQVVSLKKLATYRHDLPADRQRQGKNRWFQGSSRKPRQQQQQHGRDAPAKHSSRPPTAGPPHHKKKRKQGEERPQEAGKMDNEMTSKGVTRSRLEAYGIKEDKVKKKKRKRPKRQQDTQETV